MNQAGGLGEVPLREFVTQYTGRNIKQQFLIALNAALSGVDREGLSFISSDRYDAAPMHAFMERTRLAPPDIEVALTRWVDFLVAHAFGATTRAPSPLTLVGAPARP